ncbi:MAG: DNA-dependent DNA polymerase [Bdellovibrionaceae bacterium]|nr:DNA-dependent DNA polymerase [Pseudobdellovibrionaceae bacterium]
MNDKQVLIELIITYLRDSSNLNETTSQFVKRVRDQFVKYLLMSNTIPEPVFRDVLTDLEEEIVDIYRKKTYGYQSLKEFRISRILKN